MLSGIPFNKSSSFGAGSFGIRKFRKLPLVQEVLV
jgi:hypothetical protein